MCDLFFRFNFLQAVFVTQLRAIIRDLLRVANPLNNRKQKGRRHRDFWLNFMKNKQTLCKVIAKLGDQN